MTTFAKKIENFIALKKIAVTGVSSVNPDAANLIFNKLRKNGYETAPVNPKVTEVEGVKCYPNLSSLPFLPQGVVIASPPASAQFILEECLKLGIKQVWFHSSFGAGSYDADAVKYGEENGMEIIPVGCPMMYFPPVDFGHTCMKWMFRLTGKIPSK